MTVTICHPQAQHSHQVAWALADAGLLEKYYTSCFFDPSRLRLLPNGLQREFSKRYHPHIPPSQVVTLPYMDVAWKLAGKVLGSALHERLFYENVWWFDALIARQVADSNARIVVGYENSSREIFRRAKKAGKWCVLDAASVHYLAQKEVYTPPYSAAFLDKVNARKEAEIQLADHILTLSSYAKETYVRAGVPASKITAIPLGVDAQKFPVQKKRTGNAFTYLFIGNVKLSKGVDLLLEAFHRLDVSGKQLAIIGAMGDAESLLRQRQADVTVKGHLSHEKLREEYAGADVFVLPSRLDGFGMVVTEAMSTATPVIVSTHVGAKDLVEEGMNGWIFESGKPAALAAVMQIAYDKRNHLAAMGERAKETVSRHTWEAYRENIREFYSGVLERLS